MFKYVANKTHAKYGISINPATFETEKKVLTIKIAVISIITIMNNAMPIF